MVGISYAGSIGANSMHDEFQWYGNYGAVNRRPTLGRIPSSISPQTYTLTNAVSIPAPGGTALSKVASSWSVLSLFDVKINGVMVEVSEVYSDHYNGVPPDSRVPNYTMYEEIRGKDKLLIFDYDSKVFWLYQYGEQINITGTVVATYYDAGSDVQMAKYNRTSLALGGVVPMNPYNNNVGELLLDQSYGDYYGARRNLTILDTRIIIPNAGPFGGCAAAGFSGVSFYFKRTGKSFISYSSIYGRGGSLSNGTHIMFDASTMYDSRTGWVRDQWYSQQDVLTGITDPVSFKLEFRGQVGVGPSPHKYQVKITADCKGGGRGFSHLAKDWTDLNTFQDGVFP